MGGDPVNFTDPMGLARYNVYQCWRNTSTGIVSGCVLVSVIDTGDGSGEGDRPKAIGAGMVGGVGKGKSAKPKPQTAQCPAVSPGNIGNRTEIGNAMTRPGWQVINAKRAADISSGRAAANFPASQLWNGRGDAWRHFRWNFSMAQSMGSRAASAFANAHEVSGQNDPAELAMDLNNNAMGRAFAENPSTKGMTPDAAANLALRSGCLQTSPN